MYNKPISTAVFACMMLLFFPNFVGADEAAIKSGEKKAMVFKHLDLDMANAIYG